MTNISVFGEEKEKQGKKSIEFVLFIGSAGDKLEARTCPSEYDNLCYLGKYGIGRFDAILAWDNDSTNKQLYLGHWNDGVV